MSGLFEEILSEKMNGKPDVWYIQMLQKLQDKGEITIDDFVNTGRIITIESFLEKTPTLSLTFECIDVIKYIGGYYIQRLKSGDYYLEIRSEDDTLIKLRVYCNKLDIIENELWKNFASKKFKTKKKK